MSGNEARSRDFIIDDEQWSDDRPKIMAKRAAINDWNDLQELIRKGKMYDELKALVEATDRTTKTRSL